MSDGIRDTGGKRASWLELEAKTPHGCVDTKPGYGDALYADDPMPARSQWHGPEFKPEPADIAHQRAAAFVSISRTILARYADLFPNYAFTDVYAAIDLMAAEIKALRHELACQKGSHNANL